MIAGVDLSVDATAVVVTAESPLTVVSTAAVGGGFASARSLVNLHVAKDFPHGDLDGRMRAFVRERALPEPFVGLFTAAWTERAERATETIGDCTAAAVVTVGLSNPVAAGITQATQPALEPSTINMIVVVDAAPDAAAMVNAVATITEAKVAVLTAFGLECGDGAPATGTSTDAVVVAATGRGPRCRFGGPASDLGAATARAVRRALERGVERWLEDRR